MRSRTVALGLAFLLLLTHPSIPLAQGAPAPNGWSAVKTVPPGDELVVKLKSGQTIKGRLKVISDIHLTLARGKKREFDVILHQNQRLNFPGCLKLNKIIDNWLRLPLKRPD